VKATGNKSIIFSTIYIEKSGEGKPMMRIDRDQYKEENDQQLALKFKDFLSIEDYKIHVSLSHEDDFLTAIVILEV
jgi:phosphopantetheinyl transferase (holo-ACP synthase)